MAARHLTRGARKPAREPSFVTLERLMADKPRVAIIGGGSSGVAAALELTRRKIMYVVLEQRDDLGGIWSDEPHEASYPGLLQNTDPVLTTFDGTSWSFRPRSHATREEYAGYLAHVVLTHNIVGRIAPRIHVRGLRVTSDSMQLSVAERGCDSEFALNVEHIIYAGGIYHRRVMPCPSMLEGFEGEIIHASAIRSMADLKGRRIAILGLGNTAVDHASLLLGDASALAIIARGKTWVVPRSIAGSAIDRTAQRLRQRYPTTHQEHFRRACVAHGAKFHGQGAWPETIDFREARITVNSDILKALRSGSVEVHQQLAFAKGHQLHFVDGRVFDADVIVACTGYSYVPLVPELGASVPLLGNVLHAHIDGLWCVGCPAVWGGSPPVAQAQARVIAHAIARGWSRDDLRRATATAPPYEYAIDLVGPGFQVVEFGGYRRHAAHVCLEPCGDAPR